ncbi:MAG: hypothetical protein K0S74_17 [Chlamydiales bacterium]|jgi:carbamoyltransferase|nr:hypothetical protein [Chlamydiales bacterium]
MKKDLVVAINCPVLADGTFTYDGNIALFKNGCLTLALAEERISRKKYDGHFQKSFEFALTRMGASLLDIEAIALCSFGQPLLNDNSFEGSLKAAVQNFIDQNIPIHYLTSHHEAHALAAASQCPFEEAIIVVVDHTGNLLSPLRSLKLEDNSAEQTSYYLLRNKQLTLIARDHDQPRDAGYGRAYGDITCYLGFESYRESGKTMGLAAFGNPNILSNYGLYRQAPDGSMITDLVEIGYCEDDTKDIAQWFANHGLKIPPRRSSKATIRPFDMHLAAWIQDQMQNSIKNRLKLLLDKYGINNVCMSGGVAMNSVLNSYLESSLDICIYIPPSPGDAGIAIGAGASYFLKRNKEIPFFGSNPYLGPLYTQKEIQNAISEIGQGLIVNYYYNITDVTAQALNSGKIVGWFQGCSEYGPRALGNRSILASPRNSWTKEILNSQVKLREWFRPYAPAAQIEHASIYFKGKAEDPYMMKTAFVTEKAYTDIPACIHADGSARLQTVTKESNPLFYELIGSFAKLSGIPVILNTSFNLAGMPIVEHPKDAIDCFKQSIGIDLLVIGNYVLTKEQSL